MSSYNQVTEDRALGETLSLAVIEIVALYDEMEDLCATIAAQFPKTYERIPKYQEAYAALIILESAKLILDEPMNRVAPSLRQVPVVVVVGKQTRPNRVTSQRVRLGNAVARMKAVNNVLASGDDLGPVFEIIGDLDEIVRDLQTVTFPERYG